MAPNRSALRALVLCPAVALLASGCSSGARSASSLPSAASAATVTSQATAPGANGFDGAAIPAGRPAAGFTLTDQNGSRVSLSSYRGRVTILAFPYSTCGAACILIAEQIRGALDELGRPVPVLMISSDPRADTPASVRRFLAQTSLTGRVRYLSGSTAQLQAVWHTFHVVPASAGRASFDSAASVILLDRHGRERVIFQLEQLTPEALAHDVRKLLGSS